MSLRLNVFMGAATFILVATACEPTANSPLLDGGADAEPEADADAETETDGSVPLCYAPTPTSGQENKTWISGTVDDKGELTITAPADPGGGYIEVSVTADNTAVRPWLEITTGTEGGAIDNGSSVAFDVPVRRAAFAAAPSQVYKVRAWQFAFAPPAEYPVSYTIDWKFTSLVDCFEPNDSAAAAKPIALGETIEAYATAGHVRNSLDYAHFVDWYSFTLDAETAVKVELLEAPGTQQRMRIRIFDSSGMTQLGAGGGNAGGELFTATPSQALAPGSYTFTVETVTSSSIEDDNGPSIHEAWMTPYRVRLDSVN